MTFQTLPSDPPWLVKAASYIGFHETGNNQGIQWIIDGAKTGGKEGEPWCADFANYCLETTGYRGTRSALAKSFSRDPNFIKIAQPKRGAITVFDRGGDSGHVGFWTEDGILGGNEGSGQVMVEKVSMPLVGYYWPAGAATQPQPSAPQSDWDSFTAEVKAFQAAHPPLEVDGEVGPATWAVLMGKSAPAPPPLPSSLSAGAQIYLKLLTKFQSSAVNGTPPPDGAQFGITTGSADQWARFGTACCEAESDFNPKAANPTDPGGSYGIFQYAHSQVPGGNAYDVDASVSAFVRDTESSLGGLRAGILGRRFSTIGSHPERTIAKLAHAAQLAAEAQKAIPMTDTTQPVQPAQPSQPVQPADQIAPLVEQIVAKLLPQIAGAVQRLLPVSSMPVSTSPATASSNAMDWTHTALGAFVASVFAQMSGALQAPAFGTTSWATLLTTITGVLAAAGVLPKLPDTVINVMTTLFGKKGT